MGLSPGEMSRLRSFFPDLTVRSMGVRARVPSELEPHPTLGAELGIELWLKREDRIDQWGCGHKARKMGYVAGAAVNAGATVLVTVVSLPSSQAVAVAAAANRCGLRAHVVYCGDYQRRPTVMRGNYLLAHLLGATVTWREDTPWAGWQSCAENAARLELAAGERPYLAHPGLSAWPGLLGSVELGVELAGELEEPRLPWHVVGAAGSGGSLLGVAIGLRAAGVHAHVHGVCVGLPPEIAARELASLREEASAHLRPTLIEGARIELHDGARGAGYDRTSDDALETIRQIATRYGLLLDPTYMVKTLIGLRQLVRERVIPPGARTVLIHSGGSTELIGGSDALDEWVRRNDASRLAPHRSTDSGSEPPVG